MLERRAAQQQAEKEAHERDSAAVESELQPEPEP